MDLFFIHPAEIWKTTYNVGYVGLLFLGSFNDGVPAAKVIRIG
jgi:hypothetical protein